MHAVSVPHLWCAPPVLAKIHFPQDPMVSHKAAAVLLSLCFTVVAMHTPILHPAGFV
jgi:hypothetical protein